MKVVKLLLVPVLLAVAAGASAQTTTTGGAAVDVTGVVSTIGNQLAPIGLVGVAVLGVIVAIAAFKWVRRAI